MEDSMGEWFQDDAFWEEFFPFLFNARRLSAADEEVEQLLSLTGFHGGVILDLCCGPGRHAVALAKKGFPVTGVDRTPYFLEKAKEWAEVEEVQIEWVQEDMRSFIREDSFDMALSLFTSFGYFETKEQEMDVLRNVFRSLKPGGLFLVDVFGKELLARSYHSCICDQNDDGSLVFQRVIVKDGWSRLENEWILVRGETAKVHRFEIWAYSGRELKELLEEAGFEDVRLYGSLKGDSYGPDAKRLVALAWKGV
jgi:SAM-dependent methyltransferase